MMLEFMTFVLMTFGQMTYLAPSCVIPATVFVIYNFSHSCTTALKSALIQSTKPQSKYASEAGSDSKVTCNWCSDTLADKLIGIDEP